MLGIHVGDQDLMARARAMLTEADLRSMSAVESTVGELISSYPSTTVYTHDGEIAGALFENLMAIMPWVAPSFRRQGYGTMMVRRHIKADAEGWHDFSCHEDDDPARALFRGLGLRELRRSIHPPTVVTYRYDPDGMLTGLIAAFDDHGERTPGGNN